MKLTERETKVTLTIYHKMLIEKHSFRTDDLWFELDDDDFECHLNPTSSSLYESTRLYQSMDSAATIRPRRPPIALPPPPPRSAPPLSDSGQQHTIDTVSVTSLAPSGSSSMHVNGTEKTPATITTCNNALTRQANTVEDPCFPSHVESNYLVVLVIIHIYNCDYHINYFNSILIRLVLVFIFLSVQTYSLI